MCRIQIQQDLGLTYGITAYIRKVEMISNHWFYIKKLKEDKTNPKQAPSNWCPKYHEGHSPCAATAGTDRVSPLRKWTSAADSPAWGPCSPLVPAPCLPLVLLLSNPWQPVSIPASPDDLPGSSPLRHEDGGRTQKLAKNEDTGELVSILLFLIKIM